MSIVTTGFCVECFTAFYEESQAMGSSEIQYLFPVEADILRHLELTYNSSSKVGHHIGITAVWSGESEAATGAE